MPKSKKLSSSSTTSSNKNEDSTNSSQPSLPPVTSSDIKNKMRRQAFYHTEKIKKNKDKKKRRKTRAKEAAKLGDAAPPKQAPRTIENTALANETIVEPDDEEALQDEAVDEFSQYYSGKKPKIMITTSRYPAKKTVLFAKDLLNVFKRGKFRVRKTWDLSKLANIAKREGFTDVIVLHDDHKHLDGFYVIHLPDGPTAYFKLSSIVLCKDIPNVAPPTKHKPEIILNHFKTRLGRTIGRMFAALFDKRPQFKGRQVATFHNQRDYIFFRHHRYIVNKGSKKQAVVDLQEIGPRFTLKLKSLQQGIFDQKNPEYIFLHKPSMDVNRRNFVL